MRTIFLLVVIIISTSCAASDGGKQDTENQRNDADEVKQIENQWREALLNNDTDTLSRILADDVLITTSNGVVESKSEFVADFKSGKRKYYSLAFSDVEVRLYGNTAVVTGRATLRDRSFGLESTHPGRFTRVYVKKIGEWKMVATQATDISPQ